MLLITLPPTAQTAETPSSPWFNYAAAPLFLVLLFCKTLFSISASQEFDSGIVHM